jgi:Co/Zn/Cd efflux system component
VDFATVFYDLPLLAIGAAVLAVLIFPIVFLMSFLYESLEKKHEKTPKILLMLTVTFAGVFIAFFVIYLYVGFTLTQVLAAFA